MVVCIGLVKIDLYISYCKKVLPVVVGLCSFELPLTSSEHVFPRSGCARPMINPTIAATAKAAKTKMKALTGVTNQPFVLGELGDISTSLGLARVYDAGILLSESVKAKCSDHKLVPVNIAHFRIKNVTTTVIYSY